MAENEQNINPNKVEQEEQPFTQEELRRALQKVRARKDNLSFWHTELRDEDDGGKSREVLIEEGKVLDIAANVLEIVLGKRKGTILELSEKSKIDLK